MLKYEYIFQFTFFLRIFSHFNIIKIVTHLEVMVQNVKNQKLTEVRVVTEVRVM
jgi:hypothetical protein